MGPGSKLPAAALDTLHTCRTTVARLGSVHMCRSRERVTTHEAWLKTDLSQLDLRRGVSRTAGTAG
jgi:hypothetical protein